MKFFAKYRGIILIFAVIVAGLFYIEKRQETARVAEVTEVSGITETIFVHISGAVMNPGVYELSRDTRLFQVVEAAGGLSEDAYADNLNLVADVSDGQKIHIYTIDEWQEYQKANEDAGIVNINTADISRLMTLPGIGSSRAEAIVAYRNEHGAFESTEDIMKVSGIKEAAYSKIKEYICID